MGNVLQRNRRTNRDREYIFKASGNTNFEKFSTWCQPWCHLCGFNECTNLPQKACDKSLKEETAVQIFRQIGEMMKKVAVNSKYYSEHCYTYYIFDNVFIPDDVKSDLFTHSEAFN